MYCRLAADHDRRIQTLADLGGNGDTEALFTLESFSTKPRDEIGWEERLQNDLFCVRWNVKP